MSELQKTSQEAIEHGSQSFAMAAKLLPKETRDDAVMLYAWCRYADDVIDGQALGHQSADAEGGAEALRELREKTHLALETDAALEPPYEALRLVAKHCELPHEWPFDLIEGFEMDVADHHYQTLADTMKYCYHVAGVVGLMMARVMGVRDEDALHRACDLGLAFQLTNIARDVMDDAKIGRVYFPQDWLDEARAKVEGDIPSPELYTVILRVLDEAEGYYASGLAGLKALPARASWSIASAARIYRAIGDEIRKGGPEAYRQRIHTSSAKKLLLVGRASFDHLGRQRLNASRDGLWTRELT